MLDKNESSLPRWLGPTKDETDAMLAEAEETMMSSDVRYTPDEVLARINASLSRKEDERARVISH